MGDVDFNPSMARNAMFANETFAIAKISFSHWNSARKAGVKKADRPALLPLI